jgi:uncharacterized protein YecE (DUF72 family)
VTGRFLCGTSGYVYQHWKDVFYPPEVKPPHWLEYYAEHFDAVELNVTYYNLPKRETFEHWRERTPDAFRFAIKGSRLITHYHRLHDVDDAVAEFFKHAAGLGDKLDVVLWQLPPRMHADPERLDAFCALATRVSTVRHAFEFRDAAWFAPEVYAVLRRHGCALCVADSPTLRTPEEITAGFTYLRFHGGRVLYGSEYSAEELEHWARRTRTWLRRGIDVYAFFNNDAHGFAVSDARRLSDLVRGTKRQEGMRPSAGRVSEK